MCGRGRENAPEMQPRDYHVIEQRAKLNKVQGTTHTETKKWTRQKHKQQKNGKKKKKNGHDKIKNQKKVEDGHSA